MRKGSIAFRCAAICKANGSGSRFIAVVPVKER